MAINSEDSELLRRYAETGDGAAFAELVRRQVNLVYSVARRQVNGDPHLAEDIVAAVFADLAAKAGSVARQRTVAGWLFVSTRFAAAKIVRGEQRRRARERAALLMATNPDGETDADWAQVRPVLDEAIAQLGAEDREAILLRFFEGRGFGEVGARLQLSENTARMRVERALDKLHALLARRGVTSTTAALASVLANQAVTAAPAGLAASVAAAAVAGSAAGGAVGAGIFMGITKTQAALCGALLAAGAGGLTLQQRANAQLAEEVAALRRTVAENEAIRGENQRLAQAAGEAQALNRANNAELARLGDEAAALKARLAAAAQPVPSAPTPRTGGVAKTTAIYDVAQLDQMPAPKFRAPPKYPDDERTKGLEGKVLVEFVLDAAGEVTEAKALEATNEAFAASAVAALKQWKFSPGQKGGVPVGVRMQQPITFTISTEPTPNWF